MARVAPINLPYNIKTLWFDPGDLDISAADNVVVKTARGLELGSAASDVIEVSDEDIEKLKSPLKPVVRIATEEDLTQAEEMDRLGREAMPIFKEMARECNKDMHPVTVEYLLDGDKAIFYFEAEERVDFRELVRKLAARFHVRIDMRQIGVRDEARIVGGLAHCGQVVCCKRLGGEFNPVSIRMAKDQDLSLNPQKISGLCGRLMCCLRYESEAYKDFKSRSPKVGAQVETPEGIGKVVELDVPREIVTVKVEDGKPVGIPLADFDEPKEGEKPHSIGEAAWEIATEEDAFGFQSTASIFHMPSFTGADKLGSAKAVHHEGRREGGVLGAKEAEGSKRRGSKGKRRSSKGEEVKASAPKRQPRRRSTTIKGDSKETKVETASKQAPSRPDRSGGPEGKLRPGHRSSGLSHEEGNPRKKRKKQGGQSGGARNKAASTNASSSKEGARSQGGEGGAPKRRRRRHRSSSSGPKDGQASSGQGASEGSSPREDG